MITASGVAAVMDLIASGTMGGFRYMAIGTDSTPTASGDNALGAEVRRIDCTATPHDDNVLFTGVFPSGSNEEYLGIREVGIFNGPSGVSGTVMLLRETFDPRDKTRYSELKFEVTLTLPVRNV